MHQKNINAGFVRFSSDLYLVNQATGERKATMARRLIDHINGYLEKVEDAESVTQLAPIIRCLNEANRAYASARTF